MMCVCVCLYLALLVLSGESIESLEFVAFSYFVSRVKSMALSVVLFTSFCPNELNKNLNNVPMTFNPSCSLCTQVLKHCYCELFANDIKMNRKTGKV